MSGDRHDNSLVPTPWRDALMIVGMGHMLGLVACEAIWVASKTVASTIYPLETAAALFASGIGCSFFAFVSMCSAGFYRDKARSALNFSTAQAQNDAQTQQLAAKRLVVACLLGLSSAIVFFCGCASALMALLQA